VSENYIGRQSSDKRNWTVVFVR